MRVLLTGGSGFLGAHCVDCLLRGGHSVVFTVRSKEKGERILGNHPTVSSSSDGLSYVIVEDIAKEDAFDTAVKSNPPFEAVLHTASPYHFRITDPKTDLLDPAIFGTIGILKSIKKNAPTVKRVAITSSFAAMVTVKAHPKIYDESMWNNVTWDEALHTDVYTAWRSSKTFAEKAAWEFFEKEKPNFQISTINPPLVFSPVVHYFNWMDNINTSNERIRDMIQGKMKEKLSPTGIFIWVDVRDVALAHVRAIEISEAAGQRFLCTAGFYSNAEIANVIKKNFPDLKDKLPASYESDLDVNHKPFDVDNSRSKEVLGLN
jgi:nucleoside-diphosphate-sugar epimerase